MMLHLTLGVICVFLAAVAGRLQHTETSRLVLKISFCLIFLFLALRFDFGNDYMAYYDIFYESNDVDILHFSEYEGHAEIGWILLCQIFQPVGFFGMVAALALFGSVVYYRLVMTYCPKNYYWLAVFIYVFSVNNMLIQASAMRQAFAISIFIVSLDFLLRKKVLQYISLVFFASLFHGSALFAWVLVFLPFFSMSGRRYTASLVVLFYFGAYFFAGNVSYLLNYYIIQYFDRYEAYQEAGNIDSGVGLVILSFVFIFLVYSSVSLSDRDRLIVKVAAVSFMIIPFGLVIMMIARIGMYFESILIVAIPLAVANVKSKPLRFLFLCGFIAFTFRGYLEFFASPVWHKKFGIYQSIFSVGFF